MEKNTGLVWPHYCAIPCPWLLVDYATCLCMRQCLQILMMYPYCWWLCFILYIILSTWFHCWIQSSRAQLDIDATITKCMGVAHQWGPTDMIPGLLNVYVYIYVCETCITVCRMFLNMYAYINIYIRWYNDMMICIYLSNRIESNQIKSHHISSIYTLHYIIYTTLYTTHYITLYTLHYIHYITLDYMRLD